MPSLLRRLVLVLAPCGAVCACAGDEVRKADVDELRAEIRAARQDNARMADRLERLEATQGVRSPRAAVSSESAAVPSLTVVKLKPRSDPAPVLDTSVGIIEPSRDATEQLPTVPRSDEHNAPGAMASSALYEDGLRGLRTGNIQGGIAKLRQFAEENPRDPKADNALYFCGLGQMGLENWEGAARTFDEVIATHPAGDAVGDALLRLAECRMKLHRVEDAKNLYTRVVLNYPGTAAASQAEQRLAALK